MRSEIFNKIKQNKMEFYSELKSQNKPTLSNPEKINTRKETNSIDRKPIVDTQNNENQMVFKLPEINLADVGNSISQLQGKAQKVVRASTKQTIMAYKRMAALGNSVANSKASKKIKKGLNSQKEQLQKMNNKLNQKVTAETEKIAQGIYDVTSKLFEDKYEFRDVPDPQNESVGIKYPGNGTVEWTIVPDSPLERLNKSISQSNFGDEIKNQVKNFRQKFFIDPEPDSKN